MKSTKVKAPKAKCLQKIAPTIPKSHALAVNSKIIKTIPPSFEMFLTNFINYNQRIIVADNEETDQEDESGSNVSPIYIFQLGQRKYTKIRLLWGNFNMWGARPIMILNDIYFIAGFDTDSGWGEKDSFNYKISLNKKSMSYLCPAPSYKGSTGLCQFQGQFIYTLCGHCGDIKLNSCDKYSIATDKWAKMPNSNEYKDSVGCLVINGIIYMFGGHGKMGLVNSIENISAINGKKWAIFQLQSALHLRPIADSFPVYIGDKKIIIAGYGSNEKAYCYSADIRNRAFISSIEVPNEKILSSAQWNKFVAYATSSYISKINIKTNMTKSYRISALKKKWEVEVISIKAASPPYNDDNES